MRSISVSRNCFTSSARNKGNALTTLTLLGVLSIAGGTSAYAEPASRYEVTVQSLISGELANVGDECRTGQILGLFLFATHRGAFELFELGTPVKPELATLAESGAPFLLANVLASTAGVGHVLTVPDITDLPTGLRSGLLCAGESLTVKVAARPGHRFLSMAAMIAPTNDAFIALNRVPLPQNRNAIELFSTGYDAGSESNDELCANIPGIPGLAGCPPGDANTDTTIPDPNPNGGPGLGEGYVHIHAGIHGIGDLSPSLWDWRNPVARITIRRIR